MHSHVYLNAVVTIIIMVVWMNLAYYRKYKKTYLLYVLHSIVALVV